MMSPPLSPCQPSGAIWRHTYSAAVTTLSDTAVLTLTIVVLVVALKVWNRTVLYVSLHIVTLSASKSVPNCHSWWTTLPGAKRAGVSLNRWSAVKTLKSVDRLTVSRPAETARQTDSSWRLN